MERGIKLVAWAGRVIGWARRRGGRWETGCRDGDEFERLGSPGVVAFRLEELGLPGRTSTGASGVDTLDAVHRTASGVTTAGAGMLKWLGGFREKREAEGTAGEAVRSCALDLESGQAAAFPA